MAELDPEAQAILDVAAASGVPPIQSLSVEEARERMRATFVTKTTPLPLESVEDTSLSSPAGPLKVRLFRPAPGPLPAALFFHGGGWTLNDLDTHDHLCRRLAGESGLLVASVDYRRAPEHKHPAPLEDAMVAYRWLLDNSERVGADPTRVALVGESSGATIAAGLALLLRDLGAPMPSFQALAYPLLAPSGGTGSPSEHGSGYALDDALLEWYLAQRLPANIDESNPYAFPLAEPDLTGMPPALIMTAEFDPIRDDGVAYAERLATGGVAVDHVHAEDQMHGFLMMDRAVRRADELIRLLAGKLAAQSRQAQPSA